MYVSETDIIRTLFLDGRIININQVLDLDTAIRVGEQLGIKIRIVDEENTNTEIILSSRLIKTILKHVLLL